MGIKYLGFMLKANSYSKNDWLWILERYFKKISMWEYRSLSLAGRVVLAQSVLNQLVVYWTHMFFSLRASFINEQNHRKFYLGWTSRKKEISPLEAFLYICSKKHGWLGSVRPEVFWEGPSLQDFVERDI